ncbi:MAG: hypothetical protein J6J42_07190 [Lachnospiraceae bacterium]|nr:hypothetical protein [Lachnospiraceae bacterium]
MIKVYLMKLGLKWMARHKLRYVLSWLSFAFVSIVLICIYSISTGISDGVLNQMETNPLSYQVHMKNQRLAEGEIKSDLTEELCNIISGELGAKEFRILYDSFLTLEKIDGNKVESVSAISAYHTGHSFLLGNEIVSESVLYKGNLQGGRNENAAVVTTEFLSAYGFDMDSILGKELLLKDENGAEYSFTVVAVLYNINPQCWLANAEIYVAYNPASGNNLLSEKIIPSIVTFDFSSDRDMSEIKERVTSFGYPYSTAEINAEKVQLLANKYSSIGSFLGIAMAIISAMSLMNSVIITINENAAFMNMFRLMGLTAANHRFLICFITAVQGAIGGMAGFLFSCFAQRQLGNLIESFNLVVYEEFALNFKVDIKVSLFVMLMCIMVSVAAGAVSFVISSKESTVIAADNELV